MADNINSRSIDWDCVLRFLFTCWVFGLGLLIGGAFFAVLLAPFYMGSI